MTKFSICMVCCAAYIHHAHYGEFRNDPASAQHGACPLQTGKGFHKTHVFQSCPRVGVPDCVPNGGVQIGDGYFQG